MGKWKPVIGREVEVINGDNCGGEFANGQIGIIRSIDSVDSFTVEANKDYWWCCRDCTRPTKRAADVKPRRAVKAKSRKASRG